MGGWASTWCSVGAPQLDAFRCPDKAVEEARKAYDEMMLQQMLKIDGVESHGNATIRKQRKEVVQQIQRLLDEFDAFKKQDRP